MRSDAAAKLVGALAKAVVFAVVATVASMCSTKSDMPRKADGSCDLAEPRQITYKDYHSCGEDCVRTSRHSLQISSEKLGNDKEVVSVTHTSNRPTSDFSRKATLRSFKYEAGGETLDATRITQHNIMGYKTAPNAKASDISALDGGFGEASQSDGYKVGLRMISEVEKRAKCTMPKPSKAGNFSTPTGSW